MANTAPKMPKYERHESVDMINKKAETLVNHIRKSKHFIAFTGAGISTSAGTLSCRRVLASLPDMS